MTPVYIEFLSKPDYVIATVSDTLAQGPLTVAPFVSGKTDGRLFILQDDGYIYLANTSLVLQVADETAAESKSVLVSPKKDYVAESQQWVLRGNVIYSKLAGEEYSIALSAGNKAVVLSKLRQELNIGDRTTVIPPEPAPQQPLHLEAQQGHSIIPSVPLKHFTVTAVVNLQRAPWSGRIIDKITAGYGDGILLDIHPAHTIRVQSANSVMNASIQANKITYIAATFGVSPSSIFINGVKTRSANLTAPPQNTLPIRIGYDTNNQNHFPGTIQRARVYLCVLSDAQIQKDYEDAKNTLYF